MLGRAGVGGTPKLEISQEKLILSPKKAVRGDFGKPGLTERGGGITNEGRENTLPFHLKGDRGCRRLAGR